MHNLEAAQQTQKNTFGYTLDKYLCHYLFQKQSSPKSVLTEVILQSVLDTEKARIQATYYHGRPTADVPLQHCCLQGNKKQTNQNPTPTGSNTTEALGANSSSSNFFP